MRARTIHFRVEREILREFGTPGVFEDSSAAIDRSQVVARRLLFQSSTMLFFLLREGLRPLPKQPPFRFSSRLEARADARALVVAGTGLLIWCGLRLIAASHEGVSLDSVLAVTSACVGIRAVLRGARSLRA